MADLVEIVGVQILEAGLWKFILACAFFGIMGIITYLKKEKDTGHQLMLIAYIILFSFTSLFTLLGILAWINV